MMKTITASTLACSIRCAAALVALFWLSQSGAQTFPTPAVTPAAAPAMTPVPPPLPGTPMLTIALQEVHTPLSDVSVMVVTEAFRRAQIGLTFRRLSLARQIELANSGEIDGDVHRIAMVADKYPNLVMVPTSTNRVDVAIYGSEPWLASITREGISKLSVVLQRGIFVLSKYNTSSNTAEAQTVAGALDMVLNRRVDVAMLPYTDVEVRTESPRASDLVRWPYLWASEPMYLLLNRRNAALVPRINEALLQMKQEGFIEAAYRDTLARHQIKTLAMEPQPPEEPKRVRR
ncbi:hypothetical protein BH11PSE8_BH11PSE8_19320 [soil metagenome]